MISGIPFKDLNAHHRPLERELKAVFEELLSSGHFVGGPAVEQFELAFSKFCETRFCVGVGSGTDALRFALIAGGIQPGEGVVTVPNTFIATTEAISQAGGRPLFVDIDERTYTMDPDKLRAFFERDCQAGSGTRRVHKETGCVIAGIIPVHLYGQPAPMDPITEIAEEFGCLVVEDACQAHGAEYFSRGRNAWRRAGGMGAAAAFSFYPGKNLGAMGEAGAVTTNDERIAKEARRLRDHGQEERYVHAREGYNGRLDTLQAGILNVKLPYLDIRNAVQRHIARRYTDLLCEVVGVVPPCEPSWARSVYHLYVIQVPDREDLRRYLADDGIETGLHYPIPLHLQRAYSRLGYCRGFFPISEHAAGRIVSLPIYPELGEHEQERIVARIVDFLEKKQPIRMSIRVDSEIT